MSAHTPGPWNARNHVASEWGEVTDAETGAFVARVHRRNGDDSTGKVCEANSLLIAAAPDLLGALEALKAGVEDRCELMRRCDVAACGCGNAHPTILGERINRARHAIAKARGES